MTFDPHHRWLGISPKDQPPNHYRLLGIDLYESDAEVIRDAAERQIRHVRSYELGEQGALAQEILNELARAKACLLDSAKKAAYDEQRRGQTTSASGVLTDGGAVEEQGVVDDSVADVILTEPESDASANDKTIPAVESAPATRKEKLPPRPRAAALREREKSERPAASAASATTEGENPVPRVDVEPEQRSVARTRRKRRKRTSGHVWYFVGGGGALLLALILVVALVVQKGDEEGTSIDADAGSKTPPEQVVETPDPPRAPVFAGIESQTVDEGTPLGIPLRLQDAGKGEGALRYRLVGGYPDGVSLDGETGILQWTPSEAQGPGTYNVGVQVSRDAAFGLADTKTLAVTVREVNRAPQLGQIANQSVQVGKEVQVAIKASDPDIPPNGLRYELGSGPEGAMLDASTGEFRWTAGSDVAGRDVIAKIAVADNGTPPQRVEREFRIRVEDVPQRASPLLAKAPFDVRQARQHQAEWSKHLQQPVEITNSIGMKLALIPPGEFLMGSPDNEEDRERNEAQHRVRITGPFWLGVYEVTQEQFKRVMGSNPSYFSSGGQGRNKTRGQDTRRFPVEVSWNDATEFCRRLSGTAEERRNGFTYRLPTEAEWEYACRAGTTTPFHFGSQLNGREGRSGLRA